MTVEYEKVEEAARFLRDKGAAPRVLVILGTGLGGLGDQLEEVVEFSYAEIPNFPSSTSPGHAGRFVCGRHGEIPVAVMEGRFHFYEGYSLKEVCFPVRVARALGARTLLVTSAVGGMDPQLRNGDIVAIEDHINLIGDSPLRGPNDEKNYGPYP